LAEVAAVAAITGGASVAASAITASITWMVSRNSARVELGKVEAEMERLREGHREEERRNRQSTYHEFLDILTAIHQTLGVSTSQEEVDGSGLRYNHLLAGVLLFGSAEVRDSAYDVNTVFQEMWAEFATAYNAADSAAYPDTWAAITSSHEPAFSAAVSDLVHLMNADVTRGITHPA
jgi:hypothetical protein